jgi:hypothetical protein
MATADRFWWRQGSEISDYSGIRENRPVTKGWLVELRGFEPRAYEYDCPARMLRKPLIVHNRENAL